MSEPPTFLFTDLEGSTRTWEREPEAMERWLASHDGIVTGAVAAHGGRVFKHTGDGLCAVFASAVDAARAARDLQLGLAAAGHERVGPLRARAALHTGPGRERGGDFYGPTLNRCARLRDIGHGGQVLVSAATAALLGGADVALLDLGQHRLRDLQQPERVWQLGGGGLAGAFPALRSLDAFVHNLPVQRSSFIGREAEKDALRDLLHAHRLVTVTGVGGCGKTRLALEVAAGELDRFADGVFFVDLSTVFEPDLVGSAVAAALRAPAGPGTGDERVAELLSDRHALVVADNCEHLLDACAAVASRLLARCPRVSVLATSREPLALDGERVWRVPSMRVPAGDAADEVGRAEAVRLFVDRATAVRPGFALTRDNAGAVADICRRLDGIPLAIELAAARAAHLAPREIEERLSDRFRLLAGGRRGVQRQQTLQAVLDWSHDLLSEPERVLLRRLSVFAGGWTLEAAQGVCAGGGLGADEIVDVLGSLVVRSLVDAEDQGDHTRYRLLETVRIYAEERLVTAGEAAAVRTAHAQWCLGRAETGPDGSDVAERRLWFALVPDDLHAEADNMRQAANWWLAQGRHDLMLRIATVTINTFQAQGRMEEPEEWLEIARAHEHELSPALRARFHTARAMASEMRGEFLVANERARAAIALANDPAEAGAAHSLLVGNLTWIDPDEAERLLERALLWTRPLGGLADEYIHAARGSLALARHDYDRAAALFSRVSSNLGAPRQMEMVVTHLLRGDAETATRTLEERLGGDGSWSWFSYTTPLLLALIAAVRGDGPGARSQLAKAVALVRRSRIPLGLADCGLVYAVIAYHEGDAERASELLAAVRAATGGGLRSPTSMCVYRHYVGAVRAAIGPDAVLRARAAGAALTLEAAITREMGGTSAPLLTR